MSKCDTSISVPVSTQAESSDKLVRSEAAAGTGWTSFDRPAAGRAVSDHEDGFLSMRRTEARCDGHAGHVLPGGPWETTGPRYRVNGVALKLKPEDG